MLAAGFQPFTPFIETLRGLLMGTAIGKSSLLSVVWCVLIAFVGFRWGLKLYDRDLSRVTTGVFPDLFDVHQEREWQADRRTREARPAACRRPHDDHDLTRDGHEGQQHPPRRGGEPRRPASS